MLGRTLAIAGAVSVLGIGTAAALWPRRSTWTYGVPLPDDDDNGLAYVRAAAARDLVMGAIVLDAALRNDRRSILFALAACTIAPAADLLLARQRSGNVWQLAIHGSGIVGIAAVSLIVCADRPR